MSHALAKIFNDFPFQPNFGYSRTNQLKAGIRFDQTELKLLRFGLSFEPAVWRVICTLNDENVRKFRSVPQSVWID